MQTAIATRPKAELYKVGARSLSTHGFRHDIFEEHLRDHLGTSEPWCSMRCAARTMWARDTKAGRDGIRKRLPRVFRSCLERGLFMAIEYAPRGHGHNGEALAVKLYQGSTTDPKERQHALEQLDRMQHRRVISEGAVIRARQILGLGDARCVGGEE